MKNTRATASLVLAAGLTVLSVACAAQEGEDVGVAESPMSGNWGATYPNDAGARADRYVPPALKSCGDRQAACNDYINGSVLTGVAAAVCTMQCANPNPRSKGSCLGCVLAAACVGLAGADLYTCHSEFQKKVDQHYEAASKCLDWSGDCEPQYACLAPQMQPSVACNDNDEIVDAECKRQTEGMATCIGTLKHPCVTSPTAGPSLFTDYECKLFYHHCKQNPAVICATPDAPAASTDGGAPATDGGAPHTDGGS
jgi:hypothetical protein